MLRHFWFAATNWATFFFNFKMWPSFTFVERILERFSTIAFCNDYANWITKIFPKPSSLKTKLELMLGNWSVTGLNQKLFDVEVTIPKPLVPLDEKFSSSRSMSLSLVGSSSGQHCYPKSLYLETSSLQKSVEVLDLYKWDKTYIWES